jgi:hypothetical protein
MEKRSKKGGRSGSFVTTLDAAEKGDFEPLLGGHTQDWWNYVRERLDRGATRLMLRIENEDPAFGRWYAWLVYEGDDSGKSIALTNILIPDYETKADSALAIPDGYEQTPYFALRWDC